MPILIAPSILSADFGRLAEEVRAVTAAGADWIHVDVMDGHFVPPITIGPLVVEAIRRATPLPLDVHLMIEMPERLIGEFVRAGANRLTVHVEACRDVVAVLRAARTAGAAPGLALNPETPLEDVEPYLGQIDLLLVMGVHPGWGGQPMVPGSFEKLARARELRERHGGRCRRRRARRGLGDLRVRRLRRHHPGAPRRRPLKAGSRQGGRPVQISVDGRRTPALGIAPCGPRPLVGSHLSLLRSPSSPRRPVPGTSTARSTATSITVAP